MRGFLIAILVLGVVVLGGGLIAATALRGHGGTLEVESTGRAGTTFLARLPRP